MAFNPVQTPRDAFIQGPDGVSCHLVWNAAAAKQVNATLKRKQMIIDSEVLRLCEPMVPFRTGALIRSGKLTTVIGSGEVKYSTPYARRQYYATAKSRPYDANRGAYWFERMKTAHKGAILRLINS